MNSRDQSNHRQQLQRDIDLAMLRFFSVAACIFAAFLALYEFVLLDSEPFRRYLEIAASHAAALLNNLNIEPVEVLPAFRDGQMSKINAINRFEDYVIVTSGCDASTVFAVLIATVAAWPSPWLKKLVAVVFGLALMYALNIVRIAGMLLVEVHVEENFDLYHEWILPILLVLGPLIYFYAWTIVSGTHPADSVKPSEP